MSLQTTFCECLIYIFLGQLFRQLFLRKSEQKRYIVIVTKIVIQATLPSLVLRNISKLRTISKEGWFLIASYIVYSLVVYAVTFFLLYRRKEPNIRASMLCSALGVNIGLFFYPIIEAIGGSDGIALSAMADIPSTLTAFIFYPIIYDWAIKKGQGNAGGTDKKKDAEESEGSTTVTNDHHDENSHHNENDHHDHHEHHHHHHHHHDKNVDDSSKNNTHEYPHDGIISNTPAQTPSPTVSGDEIPLRTLSRSSTSFDIDRPTPVRRVREPESIKVQIDDGEEYTELDIVFVTPEPVELPSDTPEVRKQKRLRKIALKVVKIFTSMPIDASILGLILGPGCKVNLPTFIDGALEKMSRANTFLSMMLVGLLLNINPAALKANTLNAFQSVAVRYVGGAIGGCITYFAIGPHVSDLCKTIFAVYFILPVPVVSGTYALEKGLDPTLPILVANLTMICSFFLIWIIATVLPPIEDSSSSSLLLSSSTMFFNSSSAPINS